MAATSYIEEFRPAGGVGVCSISVFTGNMGCIVIGTAGTGVTGVVGRLIVGVVWGVLGVAGCEGASDVRAVKIKTTSDKMCMKNKL